MGDPSVCSDPACEEDIVAAVEKRVLRKPNSCLPWRTYVVCSKGHKMMVSRPLDPPDEGRVVVAEMKK